MSQSIQLYYILETFLNVSAIQLYYILETFLNVSAIQLYYILETFLTIHYQTSQLLRPTYYKSQTGVSV